MRMRDSTMLQRRDDSEPTASGVAAGTIASPADLADAVRHDALILHFDVEWSIQAVESRRVIVKFKEAIDADARYRRVVLRRVDCTVQDGVLWEALYDWLRAQDADTSLLFSGYGALAWVRLGKVVDAVHSADATGVDELVVRTGAAFDLR